MNLPLLWHIAVRYLRGKRSLNAVPILSRISMMAIGVGTAAMIILFSVFNGFEDVVKDLYKAFYPDIKITAERGKFFSLTDKQQQQLHAINGIAAYTGVIEDNVLVRSNDEQIVVTLKGIEPNFYTVNNIKGYIIDGLDTVAAGESTTAIIGMHIASQLGIDVYNVFARLMLYYPNAKAEGGIVSPTDAFQLLMLQPIGVFRIQDDFDSKYVLAPLKKVQQLFQEEGKITSLELKIKPGYNPQKIQSDLEHFLGAEYKVATRYQQNQTLYMVMTTEKWVVYAILFLVLLIASFNMVGALSLLVLEKQKDMAILTTMGMQPRMMRAIFIAEGILWAAVGGGSGLLLGTLICAGQQYFKWIKLDGAFIIDAYPVAMRASDFILIALTVISVGMLAAWLPAAKAAKIKLINLKS